MLKINERIQARKALNESLTHANFSALALPDSFEQMDAEVLADVLLVVDTLLEDVTSLRANLAAVLAKAS